MVVPFPFVEERRIRRRPAVVVSRGLIGPDGGLLWVLMVTTASEGRWPGDIPLGTGFAEAGLRVPCYVRTAKISTVESGSAARIGTLPDDLMQAVQRQLASTIALG